MILLFLLLLQKDFPSTSCYYYRAVVCVYVFNPACYATSRPISSSEIAHGFLMVVLFDPCSSLSSYASLEGHKINVCLMTFTNGRLSGSRRGKKSVHIWHD